METSTVVGNTSGPYKLLLPNGSSIQARFKQE